MAVEDPGTEFTEVHTLLDLDALLDLMGGFHDGVVREFHWVSSACVDEGFGVPYTFKHHGRLLVQRQWPDPSAIEIRMGGMRVAELVQTDVGDWCSCAKAADADGTPVFDLAICESRFVCERLMYRRCSDWMRDAVRFGEDFRDSTAIAGTGDAPTRGGPIPGLPPGTLPENPDDLV